MSALRSTQAPAVDGITAAVIAVGLHVLLLLWVFQSKSVSRFEAPSSGDPSSFVTVDFVGIARHESHSGQEQSSAEITIPRVMQIDGELPKVADTVLSQEDAGSKRAVAVEATKGAPDVTDPRPVLSGIAAQYVAAIKMAILSKLPATSDPAMLHGCQLTIRQAAGGHVIGAMGQCGDNHVAVEALEQAARGAHPLPYAGFEGTFQEELVLSF